MRSLLVASLVFVTAWLPHPSAARAAGGPDPTADLIRALDDEFAQVRKRAAVALGRLGPAAKSARPALKDRLSDQDADVRAAAAAALAKLEGMPSLDDLTRALSDPGRKAEARAEACRALAEHHWQDPAATRALEAALTAAAVKVAAAKALDSIDARQAVKGQALGKGATRVAVFNLKYVVTNSHKWTRMQENYKKELKEFEDRVVPLKTQFEALAAQLMAGDLPMEVRNATENQMRRLKQQMQEIDEEAKATLTKRQGEMLVEVYGEVAESARAYAAAHDLDLVLHFNDGVTDLETNSAESIYRKTNTGALTPMVYKPEGIDVSRELLTIINEKTKSPDKSPGK